MNTKDEPTTLPSQLRLAADIEERRQKGEDVKWQWKHKSSTEWSEHSRLYYDNAAKCVGDGFHIRLTPSSHPPCPAGYEWHNPDNVTADELGKDHRFLVEYETMGVHDWFSSTRTWMLNSNEFADKPAPLYNAGTTCRVPLSRPLPNGLVWSGTEWKMPWKPKFRVGDVISHKGNKYLYTITKVPANKNEDYFGDFIGKPRPIRNINLGLEDRLEPAPLDDPALIESIEHWTRLATGKRNYGEVPNRSCCALCTKYWGTYDKRCEGCPVKAKTGKTTCVGSPYEVVSQNWNTYGLDSPQFLFAAQKELDFLISLKVENQGKKADARTPKFRVGEQVKNNINGLLCFVEKVVSDGTYTLSAHSGFWNESDLSPAPFNLYAHVRKSFPTLADDAKFHREDWSEDMLPDGWRPCLLNERIVADCEWKDEHDPKAKWLPDPDVIGRVAAHWNHRRTRRPLPTPPKLVPLDSADWMKDGPWWVRQINSNENPWLVVRATQLSESSPTTMERSNDGIKWTKCGKVVEL